MYAPQLETRITLASGKSVGIANCIFRIEGRVLPKNGLGDLMAFASASYADDVSLEL